jgi:AcrR family transcriptional regulator
MAARSPKPRRRRQPGRPAEDAGAPGREALLEAASRLFAEDGVSGVSLRRIAEEAGVTPAMVHYYFGSKEGLYDALLERTFSRVLERVGAVIARGGALAELLDVLIGTFAAEPWIPPLVIREVLSEGGRFREQFVAGYASRMAELLPGLVRREIDAGHFRADLDPKLAFLSVMGMTIMPFVARPVVGPVLGIDYGEDFLRRFADHTQRLFLEGAKS